MYDKYHTFKVSGNKGMGWYIMWKNTNDKFEHWYEFSSRLWKTPRGAKKYMLELQEGKRDMKGKLTAQ